LQQLQQHHSISFCTLSANDPRSLFHDYSQGLAGTQHH
jgi:hypothetical protein